MNPNLIPAVPLYDIPALDLLTIQEVTALPGVRQARSPLPPPFMDLSKFVPTKGNPFAHRYWLRSDIQRWLELQNKPLARSSL